MGMSKCNLWTISPVFPMAVRHSAPHNQRLQPSARASNLAYVLATDRWQLVARKYDTLECKQQRGSTHWPRVVNSHLIVNLHFRNFLITTGLCHCGRSNLFHNEKIALPACACPHLSACNAQAGAERSLRLLVMTKNRGLRELPELFEKLPGNDLTRWFSYGVSDGTRTHSLWAKTYKQIFTSIFPTLLKPLDI